MFGVVLWSNPRDSKAVIWCEDHGDLAFFNSSCTGPETVTAQEDFFDPGDYVQFDLAEDSQIRRVRNAKVVHVARTAHMPERLCHALGFSHSHSSPTDDTTTGQVISFSKAGPVHPADT